MQYTITGEIAQYVRLDFQDGEWFWSSKGSLMAYSSGIDWQLRVPGGVGGAINRSLSGEGVSLTYVQATQAAQHVLLTANQPGHITTWDLETQGPVITTRGAFLAAWGEKLDISVSIARRGCAAVFGGAGLFLQRIAGKGTVLVHGSGDFTEQQLAANESILVSTGNLAAFSDQVDYDIRTVGGVVKTLFGGEGLFITHLTGPGRVLLQTLKRQSGTTSSVVNASS